MQKLAQTARTTLRRRPARGSYDRELVHAIIDDALICHVGFVVEGHPFVTPTICARIGERLYIHGSAASRTLRRAAQGIPLCVTVTHVDALVLARSAFHHSMNYRSVMIFGNAAEVLDATERLLAFEAIVNHIVPGRSSEVRVPSAQELKATSVLALPITEASAKVRTGFPVDLEEDYALPCWAGLVPLKLKVQTPIPDARLHPGAPLPAALLRWREEA